MAITRIDLLSTCIKLKASREKVIERNKVFTFSLTLYKYYTINFREFQFFKTLKFKVRVFRERDFARHLSIPASTCLMRISLKVVRVSRAFLIESDIFGIP